MISATFDITGWDEKPFDEEEGLPKLTKASVTKKFSGEIEGESVLEYVMAYAEDGTATFVGIERIRGTIGGRTGSLALQHVGRFADGAATAEVTTIPGSGTGQLAGVAGTGQFRADPDGSMNLELD